MRDTRGSETLYVRIPREVKDALLLRAERDRRSMSGEVAFILEEYLKGTGDLEHDDERKALAKVLPEERR